MNETQQRMLKLLNDTAEHYTKDNRNVAFSEKYSGYGCAYLPTDSSEGCAIGRHLSEIHKKLIEEKDLDTCIGVGELFYEFKQEGVPIPEIFENLPMSFLGALQALHDMQDNWDATGLTDTGKKVVEYIRECIHKGGHK